MKLLVSLSRLDPLNFDPNRKPFAPIPTNLFHGTAIQFDNLDMNHAGKNDWGYLGRGMYFTSDANHAALYARKSAQKTGKKRDAGRVLRHTWRKTPRLYPISVAEHDILFAASRRRDDSAKKMSEYVTQSLRNMDFDGAIYVHPTHQEIKEIVLYDLSFID